ncbi:TonB-dependent hemoglobin/transferrin/lactoferrin family receptor [Microvirga thermotolerans]|uniref:TonB-dependent hemoglobin/transferrin/lactoferrin family receptor n=1 Tax=Microvirga thermotolerans TaxID=2651334 RepID=A0A5P9JY45_9HYPH|nr:TonB-dependent hemoglobin/transferrin/lactoferrin family receptor [Microvirga thermotolerans]QFU14874.1 TonB-dependent hemoglobin/transferrin/lactoferrin family receptor [Microvirga thermotolerans]
MITFLRERLRASASPRTLVLAALAGLPLAAPAQAQTAPAAPGGEAVALDTITVTSGKTEDKAIDDLAGSSVVTRRQIDLFQSSRVSDVLQGVPGVSVQETGTDPGQAVNIRGLQDFGRVNVLVDGARQDYQVSGHGANGTFYLDPALIGQVDVTRGPVSTVYGSGAIGGVVSFRTRTIDDILKPDENYGAVQTFGVGTNGAGILTNSMAGARIGTAADVFGQFLYRNTGNYRDGSNDKVRDSDSELTAGLFKFNLYPADGHTVSGSALLQNYDFTNNGDTGAGTRFRNDVTANTFTLGYRFNRPDIPWLDLSLKGFYTSTEDRKRVVAPTTTYSALGVRPGAPLNYSMETAGFDFSNTARFETFGLNHALTVGIDGAQDQARTRDRAGGYGAAFTPSGQRNLFGGFVQDEVRFTSWLRAIGALRFDSYELSGGGIASDGSRVSPKLTVGIEPIEGIEFYGTYAEGYRAPSITETLIRGSHPFPIFNILPNPNLRPEVAHNLEGGVNVQYDGVLRAGDSFRAKASVFRNEVDDYIDSVAVGPVYNVPVVPGMPVRVCAFAPRLCAIGIQDQQYRNIASARLQGAELEAAYDWGGGFVSVAGTIVSGRNEETGGPLNTVLPNRVSTTVGFRLLDEKLTVGTRLTFVDDTRRTVTNPEKGYGLVDLFASYRHSENVSGDLSIQNLFDRQYTQYRNSSPSPGLTAKFGLTVKFASR